MPTFCWDNWHIDFERSSCREFDLTWTQEALFLTLMPGLIFICLSWKRLASLRTRDDVVGSSWKSSILLGSKLLLAFIALAATLPVNLMAPFPVYSMTIEAAATKVDMLVNLHILLLTYFEYRRTLSTGDLLPGFLSLSVLGDMIRLRTCKLVEINSVVCWCLAVALAAKACLLLLENVNKRSILLSSTKINNAEATACFFSRLTLSWFSHYLWKGWHGTIKLADLGQVDDVDVLKDYQEKFDTAWQTCQFKRHPLLRTLWRTLSKDLFHPVLPLCGSVVRMLAPLLLGALLRFLDSWKSGHPQPVQMGWAIVIGYGAVTMGDTLFTAAANSRRDRLLTRLAALIQGVVFKKALRIDVQVASDLGSGTLSSYESIDVERITNGLSFFYSLLKFILVTTIGMITLWSYFGAASLGVLLSLLVVCAAIPLVSQRVLVDQTLWSKGTDARVKLITSILYCMKAIKLQAYEVPLLRTYFAIRQDELQKQRKYRRRNVAVGQFANVAYAVLRMSTFLVLCFAARHHYGRFDYATVFVCYNVLESLTGSFWNLTWRWGSAISAVSSVERIESFLLKPDKQILRLSKGLAADTEMENDIAVFSNASLGIRATNTTVLHDVTANIPRGKLSMVIGHTASGKSTLLHAILSEIDLLKGNVRVPTAIAIAYASQTPYLPAETIEENIIYHSAFDSQWYQQVLRLVCLNVDIEMMEEGDEVPAAQLSGGQKARVALARALYAKAPINLLDDTFSALDHGTASQIFENLFGQAGALCNSTTVIVTNDPALLHRADHIIELANGSAVRQGNASAFQDYVKLTNGPLSPSMVPVKGKEEAEKTITLSKDSAIDREASLTTGGLIEAGAAQFKIMGFRLVSVSLLVVVLWSCQDTGTALFLRAWSKAPNSSSISWMASWIAVNTFFACCAASWWLVWKVTVPMSVVKDTHERLTRGYFQTSIRQLQEHAPSFMVNRFSADMFAYETEYLTNLAEGLGVAAEILPHFIIATLVTRLAALALAFFLVGGYAASRIYAATQTQVRSLEAAAKTPLYAAIAGISETNGLRICRGLRKQEGLLQHTYAAIANVRRPALLLKLGLSFYAVILGICVTVVVLTLVSSAVIYRSAQNDLLALAMVQLCALGSLITPLFDSLAKVDTHSVSVQRLKFVADLPPEDEEHSVLEASNVESVPTQGDLCFKNVSLRYSHGARLALKNANLRVKAGQKVGICGRTGSGKSSLLSCLFRLVDVEDGSISIGGKDITSVSRYALRKALTIIPQDPLLLELSVRENLDVEGTRTDNEIWDALEQTGVKALVERLPGKLDHPIESNGGSISQGQRQLLALTRAHLRGRKILCLDEASSSVDVETDQVMQKALREAHDTTMLVVAHRVSTIVDMDLVIVLDQGEIVESGPPQELLKKQGGKFAKLAGIDLES